MSEEGRVHSVITSPGSAEAPLANSIKIPPQSQGLAPDSHCLGPGGETDPVVPTAASSCHPLRSGGAPSRAAEAITRTIDSC